MWLINVKTYQLEYFIDDRHAPAYAILSHTWGEAEVDFQEFRNLNQTVREKAGFRKIRFACEQALKEFGEGEFADEALYYVWVDTCCIDKTSSAELSEAINSMFEWYSGAEICFAYLEDVLVHHVREQLSPDENLPSPTDESFSSPPSELSNSLAYLSPSANAFGPLVSDSRWFTRGWTLQELLAPEQVKFFSSDWSYLGSKLDHLSSLADITRIPVYALTDPRHIWHFTVAARLSWASKRSTTRVEDTAYSLLGILGVNMPLIYGEREEAFTRLQEEVLRRPSGDSIFAWTHPNPNKKKSGIFADGIIQFAYCGTLVRDPHVRYTFTTSLTNIGVEIQSECFCTPGRMTPQEKYLRLPYKDGRTGEPIYMRLQEIFVADSQSNGSQGLICFMGWGTGSGSTRCRLPKDAESQGLQKLSLVHSLDNVPGRGRQALVHVDFSGESVMFERPAYDQRIKSEAAPASIHVRDERTHFYIKSIDDDYGVIWMRENSGLVKVGFTRPPLWDAVLHLAFEIFVGPGRQVSVSGETIELTVAIDFTTGKATLRFRDHNSPASAMPEVSHLPHIDGSHISKLPSELRTNPSYSDTVQMTCGKSVLRAEVCAGNFLEDRRSVSVGLSILSPETASSATVFLDQAL